MAELNLGVLLVLDSNTNYSFQNYKVASDVTYQGRTHTFAPFSFSGAISNLQGDNLDANLIFVSNSVTRAWAETAIHDQWVASVKVMLLAEDSTIKQVLYSYTGLISSGGWDDTRVELSMSTVLDAVRGSVPGRKINHQLVGEIPITATINV